MPINIKIYNAMGHLILIGKMKSVKMTDNDTIEYYLSNPVYPNGVLGTFSAATDY